MVLELMGVRLLAPYFGQSQIVWTNVIGVVLAAIALGQWWGGRLAEQRRAHVSVYALAVAGAFALALPTLLPWLSERALPDGLRLHEAAPFISRGSLLVAVLGLGAPLLALGIVTPCLVRLSREVELRPGAVTGRLLGVGTLGSLAGTFGATHLLLPTLGSASAMRVGGGLLLVAAAALWWGGARVRGGRALVALLPALIGVLPSPPAPGEARVLEARETAYQYVRVMEAEEGRRWLVLNEGLDSFHSVWSPDSLLTGDYYDAFLLPSLLAGDGSEGDGGSRRVLVVGLAAGTMARQLLALDPDAEVTGVELDAELVAIGRRWFGLPSQVDVVTDLDGRVVLERAPERWGAVLVDAFSSQIYIPPQLATVEAFDALRRRLEPGGWAAVNVSARGIEDPVADAVLRTFAAVFPGAVAARVPGSRNLFVLGCRGAPVEPGAPAWRATLEAAGLLPDLAWLLEDSRWVSLDAWAAARGSLLRDGDAPLEGLAHRAWAGEWAPARADREPEGERGSVAERLEAAALALAQTRWSDAERLLRSIPAEGLGVGELARRQLLLGNVAFERGDWATAEEAYDAVPGVRADDSPVARAARANTVAVRAERDRQRELEGQARWLGWCVLAALASTGGAWLVLVSPRRARVQEAPAR